MSKTNEIELKYENLTVCACLSSSGNTEITYRSSRGADDMICKYFKPESLRKLAAFLTEQADIAEGKGKTYEDADGGTHKIIFDCVVGVSPFVDADGRCYSGTGERYGANGPDLVREVAPKPKSETEGAPAEAIAALTKRVEVLEEKAEPEPEPITMKVGEYYVTSMGITVKCMEGKNPC